jgi:hypothetical protein
MWIVETVLGEFRRIDGLQQIRRHRAHARLRENRTDAGRAKKAWEIDQSLTFQLYPFFQTLMLNSDNLLPTSAPTTTQKYR